MRRPRRIFVDFTLVDYRTRVTGIPRVAYAYLEEGYALAAELGLEVLPVYVRNGELIDARPFLVGSNLRRFRRQPGLGSLLPLLGSCLYFVLHVLRLVAVSCVVPFFRLASLLLTFEFFDLWKNLLHSSFRKGYFSLKRRINDGLGRRVAFQSGDVLFMPAYWHDTQPGLYLQLKRKGLVLCPLVHDILPITHPEFYESPWREQFERWVPELLSLSDHIYYVSEATREAVAAVNASRYHRELPAGTVLHHGSDFSRRPSAPARAASPAVSAVLEGAPYLLMVGSIEPKKNHLKVLAELEALWRRRVNVNLVIVGTGGWKNEEILLELKSNPHLHGSLLWLENVGDEDLGLLYRSAAGLIQASEAEGFGLPLIEALAQGGVVLANDIPVFRELASAHATFFDIHREGDLGQKVERLLQESTRPATAFSWPTWHERARALYADLLARSPRPQAAQVHEGLKRVATGV
ncbi:glycosyltransferase family 1 protein [Archangium sp.]|uniref:glycosyltransferase family 4 protein n=1 Tax=Archangium sp. TaxID=1872627 RepID=UPI00286CC686|nr:glycosyltransferase family 1 protein [Archangium sp.]